MDWFLHDNGFRHERVKETRIIYRAEHILGSLFKNFFLDINCDEIFFKATKTRNVDTGIANDRKSEVAIRRCSLK